jgi:YegS/Rv2252/BmrU family lipid kinase
MQDSCIVLNPFARTARSLRLQEVLPKVAFGATVWVTTHAGEAEALARKAVQEGFKTIVAAGGDGTVNEVVRGMSGSAARLGVLPVGTVNVFARELGLPLDWEESLIRLQLQRERVMDLAWADERPFVQLAGIGFDAEVVAAVSPADKKEWGPMAYVATGLTQITRLHPRLTIMAEGFEPVCARWVLVGTGRFYGGPIPVFPKANPADGLLDVLAIEDVGWMPSLAWMLTMPLGWHTRLPGVTYFQTSKLRVEGDAALELDGEACGRGSVDFRVSPNTLRVLV